ncbi:MAG: hypothetical protein PHU14_12420 [Methylovulum sp.]|nr:hypothetical protein [Methylovulum sp.]
MYAVEFKAKIENGIVTIPKEYSGIYHSQARVLVLVDDVDIKETGKKDYAAFFEDLRNRPIKIQPDIDIGKLIDGMNDGLS